MFLFTITWVFVFVILAITSFDVSISMTYITFKMYIILVNDVLYVQSEWWFSLQLFIQLLQLGLWP